MEDHQGENKSAAEMLCNQLGGVHHEKITQVLFRLDHYTINFNVSFAQNRVSNQQEMSAAHYIRTNLETLFPEWIYRDIDTMVAGSQRETIKLLLAK